MFAIIKNFTPFQVEWVGIEVSFYTLIVSWDPYTRTKEIS
jgi:hypothetical protein